MNFFRLAAGLGIFALLVFSTGIVRIPHYVHAVWDNICESVYEHVDPELHVDAARKQIDAAEQRAADAMRVADKYQKSIVTLRKNLAEAEAGRIAITEKIRRNRDILARYRDSISGEKLTIAVDETRRIEKAYREACGTEERIREQISANERRHGEIAAACREILTNVEIARSNLENQSSQIAVDQADRLLDDAANLIAKLTESPEESTDDILDRLRNVETPQIEALDENADSIIARLGSLLGN